LKLRRLDAMRIRLAHGRRPRFDCLCRHDRGGWPDKAASVCRKAALNERLHSLR
jgi:hypothetical protein